MQSVVPVLVSLSPLLCIAYSHVKKGTDFKALSDSHNKWTKNYDEIRDGLMKPLFLVLPELDTKYLNWFKKRQETHNVFTQFLKDIDAVIEEKRQMVREKKSDNVDVAEKDLLTLMIESEARGEGKGLSNEELTVKKTCTHTFNCSSINVVCYTRVTCCFSSLLDMMQLLIL
jgi:hypothetical protein